MRSRSKIPWVLWAVALAAALLPGLLHAQQAGEGWKRIGLQPGPVSAIGVSPGYDTAPVIFVGVKGGGLWRGARQEDSSGVYFDWTRLSSVPASSTVTAIAFDPDHVFGTNKPVFVGTEEGLVYSSTNDFSTVLHSWDLSAPIMGLTAWIPDASVYLVAGTWGAGIFRSTDLLATFPSQMTGSGWEMCRALARDGNNIYAGYFLTPDGLVMQCDGTAGIPYWTTKGFFTGAVPSTIEAQSACGVLVGTENRGTWVTFNISDDIPSWFPACDGTDYDMGYRVNALLSAPPFAGEVWEARSDGLFTSDPNYGCLMQNCLLDSAYAPPINAIAFAPSFGGETGIYHEAFVGTQKGLFIFDANTALPGQNERSEAPKAIGINDVAMSQAAPPGTWAAGPAGLFRNKVLNDFIQYNAFYGAIPDVAAVALAPGYLASGACGGSQQTLFIAERSQGVFKSTDNGDTWVQMSEGWPTSPPVLANDLAVSPSYPADPTLYAATTDGLYRWSGTAWERWPDFWPSLVEITRVALPNCFLRGGLSPQENTVAFAVRDPNPLNAGLYYSRDAGITAYRFSNMAANDITAVTFSPSWDASWDQFLFVSRATSGAWYTSHFDAQSGGGSQGASWCSFSYNLNPDVRDLQASPRYGEAHLYLLAGTSNGPYYCDFMRASDSNAAYCAESAYTWNQSGGFNPPSGCPDTLSVSWGLLGDGSKAAVGTVLDGVFFSSDGGQSFPDQGDGYTSLPDDIWASMPSPRSDNVVFASSPGSGVFVSTDGGKSFWPWNQTSGGSFCVEGAQGLGLVKARDCLNANQDAVFAGASSPSASNAGLRLRWIQWDGSAYQFDTGAWGATSLTAGSFQRVETAEVPPAPNSTTWRIWAVSGTNGFFQSTDCTGISWTADSPTTTATTGLAYGEEMTPVTALASGAPVGPASVAQGEWAYYSIQVPYGAERLLVYLDVTESDPDLYIRYGGMPSFTSCDFFSNSLGLNDDVVCAQPALEGIWYIGVYGYGTTNTYELTATLDGTCAREVPGARPKKAGGVRAATSPQPDAPSTASTWGTVSGSGVYKETTGARLAGTTMASTWEPRNGTGWGELRNKLSQAIVQLPSGDLLCGANGALYISTYPDEGQTTWTEVRSCVAGNPSWNITDFLRSPDGDLLVAMEGTLGSGGVWLSGNGGTCWMKISEGFDGDSQYLQDLVCSDGTPTKYYSATDGTGLYKRTITPDARPTVSSVDPIAADCAGGTPITVTGTGFMSTCITGNPDDCPYGDTPIVWFGGTPVAATCLSGTELTVSSPAHAPGSVVISVMNADTRSGSCSPNCTFTFAGDVSEGPTLTMSQSGGRNLLEWTPQGQVIVERSMSPQFTVDLKSTRATGCPWSDPDAGAATDGNTYYYRVR